MKRLSPNQYRNLYVYEAFVEDKAYTNPVCPISGLLVSTGGNLLELGHGLGSTCCTDSILGLIYQVQRNRARYKTGCSA